MCFILFTVQIQLKLVFLMSFFTSETLVTDVVLPGIGRPSKPIEACCSSAQKNDITVQEPEKC